MAETLTFENTQEATSIDNLSAEVDICNDRYGHMLGIKDNHIKQLQDLALEKPKSHSNLNQVVVLFEVHYKTQIIYLIKNKFKERRILLTKLSKCNVLQTRGHCDWS